MNKEKKREKVKKIIINADDLGFNPIVNKAIEEALDAGVITSSTIMAAGTAVEEVSAIVLRHPEASFGVHLCLDEVRPLSSSAVFAKFGALDAEGILKKGWYTEIKPTKELVAAIYDEWKTQIDYVISQGIPVSHLDSHHHAHNLPYFREVLLKLTQEYKIYKVRLPLFLPPLLRRKMELSGKPIEFQSKARQGKIKRGVKYLVGIVSKYKEYNWTKKSFTTTDFFCHASTFFNNTEMLKRYETVEIMCHPGHPAYKEETKSLFSFKYNDIQKISYKDL